MADVITRTVDRKAFDMEYSTQWRREYEFLVSQGIKPTFVKLNKETGIRTYKFTKTPALFKTLLGFYSMVKAEKDLKEAEEVLANGEKFYGEIPEEFSHFKATVI